MSNTHPPSANLIAQAHNLLTIAEQSRDLIESLVPVFTIIGIDKAVVAGDILMTINTVIAKAKGLDTPKPSTSGYGEDRYDR